MSGSLGVGGAERAPHVSDEPSTELPAGPDDRFRRGHAEAVEDSVGGRGASPGVIAAAGTACAAAGCYSSGPSPGDPRSRMSPRTRRCSSAVSV
jgi:hypothetical protein